jgi:2-methylisocitrate lyase-like PEP mutase family enzyme
VSDSAARFRALHVPGEPLLMPNPWDAGSARLLAGLGFRALATTSSGHATSLGRKDGEVSREEALAHAAALVAAVAVPVSADLENGFADDPHAVAQTISAAAETGLAGGSIEDFMGEKRGTIYCLEHAVARIEAAVAAARASGFVVTARAENLIRGVNDLEDTIRRLVAYEAAGADVLYAPGLVRIEDIRRVLAALERPLNVLALPGTPGVAELADAGVARISVGGAFSQVARTAVTAAARELLDAGTFAFTRPGAGGQAR